MGQRWCHEWTHMNLICLFSLSLSLNLKHNLTVRECVGMPLGSHLPKGEKD